MDKNIKKVTVTDFRAGLSHYLELLKSGAKIEVRGVILVKLEDVHEKTEDVQTDVQMPVQTEDKPVVQDSVIDQLRAQVTQIENGGKVQQIQSLAPEPEVWHKEELEEEKEEEKFVNCDVCKDGQAEKTFYDAGDFGEVEICRQCARSKYMGSMRNFDKYWKGLQDIKIY